MAHLARGLEHFHGLPDVGQARGLRLRILKDAGDPNLENSADESTEQDSVADDALQVENRVNVLEVDTERLKLADFFQPLDDRQVQLDQLVWGVRQI